MGTHVGRPHVGRPVGAHVARPTQASIFINVLWNLILACKLMFADDKPKDDKPKVSAFTGKGAKLGKK